MNKPQLLRLVLAPDAQRDLTDTLRWSKQRFGELAAERYRVLIKQAIRDIRSDPTRAGSKQRPELAPEIRSYHLFHSRDRARTKSGIVRTPRHLIIYRVYRGEILEVLRVLHDSRDLSRHVPG